MGMEMELGMGMGMGMGMVMGVEMGMEMEMEMEMAAVVMMVTLSRMSGSHVGLSLGMPDGGGNSSSARLINRFSSVSQQ